MPATIRVPSIATRDALRLTLIGIAVAIAYVAAARVGFWFAFVAEQVTIVWAPTGIGMAALLLWGLALWPAVWVGAFVANAGADVPLWAAAAVATGNTLEGVVAAWALRRAAGFDPRLQRIRDVFSLAAIGAGASTVISATIGVTTLCASGVQSWAHYGQLWRAWWLGDAVGALVVAPPILTLARHRTWARRGLLEACLLIVGAAAVLHVVFGQTLDRTIVHQPLEYVIFPFVIAAAMRSGQPATSLVVLSASAVTIWHTVRGFGPFAGAQPHDSLVLLQVFMGMLAGTGLLLAAAIAERETGERRRAAANAVGDVLDRAEGLRMAAPEILRAICGNLEWQTGALWLLDQRDERLHCVSQWTEEGVSAPAFERATREMTFPSGLGLPGRVLASGKPVWIENVVDDTNFPRAPVAREAGLHGAFGFPICLDTEVLGVIECFNRTIVPPDADLLHTIGMVGNQIGQFIGRKREAEAVRQAEHERERLLAREARARSEAEAANRAKDEFLATLSHELRTPLNAIVGWTRMLLDGTMDPRSSRRALEVIDRNAQLLAQLVGDILDVSRIITGGLRLDPRPVDLGSVIGAALDAVRPAAEAKRLRLASRFGGSTRLVQGDPQRLQQVIWNLLANAVKFTEAGGTVTIELLDGGGDRVNIRVSDDGAGIDPSFLPFVFERFRQGDGSATRQHGGLGLGLAIVRHLVELHGGTVRAESAGAGRGSTFTVTLPSLATEPNETSWSARPLRTVESAESRAPRALEGYRLLIVDDQEDARDLIAAILRSAGAHVDTAVSAGDALEQLKLARPHALLADIGMPGADGYALIREVRIRDAQLGSHLPAAAITAYVSDGDRETALAAGFDCHLAKPISQSALVSAVLSMWPDSSATP